jgi:hypothetical protein
MRLIVLISLVLFSCKKQSNTTTNSAQQTVVKDCNCDRVAKVFEYNVTPYGTFYDTWLINDCSGVQTFKTIHGNKPILGQCYN